MHTTSRTTASLFLVATGAMILACALLRLLALDHLLLWHDEVFTLVRAFGYQAKEIEAALFSDSVIHPSALLAFQYPDPARGWGDALHAFMEHPEHAPLYYALVRVAAIPTTSLGISPVSAARAVSALAGVLLIPATYWLTRELFGRGATPWLAVLLVACSPMHFLYAQEARQYALWTLMVVTSSAALVGAMRQENSNLRWWLYGGLLLLGLYTHLLFTLMIPLHGAYIWLARGQRPSRRILIPWSLAVVIALLLFSPWIYVVLTGHSEVSHYTKWMAHPVGRLRTLAEWGPHLTRLFADLNPAAPGWWMLLLAPLALALVYCMCRAPRPAFWLPAGIALTYIAAVLLPDLVLGGSRSQHIRYALPAMLALQLMVAWVIGAGLATRSALVQRASAAALGTLLLLGALSLAMISRADSWWTKQFSSSNAEVARSLNAAARPLVLASPNGVAVGELISLAHLLQERVPIFARLNAKLPPLDGYSRVVVFAPWSTLKTEEAAKYRLTPIAGTWQWFSLEPKAE